MKILKAITSRGKVHIDKVYNSACSKHHYIVRIGRKEMLRLTPNQFKQMKSTILDKHTFLNDLPSAS